MVWLKNLESIAVNSNAGICPHCSSLNTDYSLVGNVGETGYGVIWCNDCKRAYVISRVIINGDMTRNMTINKKIPDSLIFD